MTYETSRALKLVQVRIPVSLYARIVRQSQSSGRSMEDLYQDAVRALLQAYSEKKNAFIFRASYKGQKAYNLNVRLPGNLYELVEKATRKAEVSKTSLVYTALYEAFDTPKKGGETNA
ncbi:MAG: hypothetical protein M1353_07815 [Nitrospirae bacterium]|nr:hypothetical protein [Nitrospirota bacterium]